MGWNGAAQKRSGGQTSAEGERHAAGRSTEVDREDVRGPPGTEEATEAADHGHRVTEDRRGPGNRALGDELSTTDETVDQRPRAEAFGRRSAQRPGGAGNLWETLGFTRRDRRQTLISDSR